MVISNLVFEKSALKLLTIKMNLSVLIQLIAVLPALLLHQELQLISLHRFIPTHTQYQPDALGQYLHQKAIKYKLTFLILTS